MGKDEQRVPTSDPAPVDGAPAGDAVALPPATAAAPLSAPSLPATPAPGASSPDPLADAALVGAPLSDAQPPAGSAADEAPPAPEEQPPGPERLALARAISGSELAAAPRLAAFLRFVVEETLAGRSETLKGYTIAVEALGRPPSFDPQSDPIVRVEATRLRRALERYYATAGASDPVRITIPKGTYVPIFAPAEVPAAEAAAPADPVVAEAAPAGLVPADHVPAPGAAVAAGAAPSAVPQASRPAILRPARIRTAVAATVALALVGGLALAVLPGLGTASRPADRIRLPVMEVRGFESTDPAIPSGALRAIEERLRDTFARFDFVDIKIGGPETPEAEVASDCSGPRSRSVFSLAGLAEPREDGTFSLVTRLADRCQGTIIWSHVLDGLKAGADLAASEERVVREMASALMNGSGVVLARARARAQAATPLSGFGCLTSVLSTLRGEAPAPQPGARACLDRLAEQEGESAIVHAVRAVSTLDATLQDTNFDPPRERLRAILDEAELAADLAPASAFVTRALALVQLLAGDAGAAASTALRALELNPIDDDGLATVGTVLIGAGQVEQGEALLLKARARGAVHAPLQEAYLALAAFLRSEPDTASALLPQLTLKRSMAADVALALVLHTLGRDTDADAAVQRLVLQAPGGPETVRRMVRRLLPAPALADRVLAALETAGLPRVASVRKQRG